jgi:hypothetical protein
LAFFVGRGDFRQDWLFAASNDSGLKTRRVHLTFAKNNAIICGGF